jgi:FtsH-binding integral membrane protein
MSLINKIGKKNFFIITTVLLLITLVNYSEIKELDSIRMNTFFSGFFAGILIGLIIAGIVNYSKFKK